MAEEKNKSIGELSKLIIEAYEKDNPDLDYVQYEEMYELYLSAKRCYDLFE